ncbi:hypothetical protein N431DRAFT_464452 [Stipitochalara longipes BDJ]|nr:hypothetical protein N431DRAFT_464452 [Stipitochalara longipes BDJ]
MPRAAHRKSRHGCSNCKQRRVKCDEQKPSCERCISRDITCTYHPSTTLIWTASKSVPSNGSTPPSTPSQSRNQNQSSTESSSTSRSTPSTSTHEANPAPLNLEGIALIIHWFTTTVHTVVATSGPNASALELCQTMVLDQAMKHDFLLHGLLALSALHLADTQSTSTEKERYTQLATAHHNQGLAMYHGILDDVNEANYAASIAFSSLTAMFAFGLYRPGQEVGDEVIDDLCRIFLLAKGWGVVVGVLDPTADLVGSRGEADSDSFDEETEKAFSRLQELNRTCSKEEDIEVYTLAIESLKSVFNEMAGVEKGSDPHVSMAWMAVMPEKCVRLLKEKQCLALLLLAYYCVVLERAPKVWWLRGWSTGLLQVVRENIGHSYKDELKWIEGHVK